MFDRDEEAREALVSLLNKLGLKSANYAVVSLTLTSLSRALQMNHGAPDKLYMDASSYAALTKFLKPDPKLAEEDDKS